MAAYARLGFTLNLRQPRSRVASTPFFFDTRSELMIMLAVMRLGKEAYGVPIAREITDRTGWEIAAGVVYSALERLEDMVLSGRRSVSRAPRVAAAPRLIFD